MGYDWWMTILRFGLKLSQNATIDQLRDLWRLADDAGFDSCWVMDHFATLGPRDDGPIFETWTMLAAMAQLTTRTRIGCAVVGNTYRHPGGAGEDGRHGRPPVRRTAGVRHRRRLGRERAHHAGAGVRHAGTTAPTASRRASRSSGRCGPSRAPRSRASTTGCRTPSPSRSRCSSRTRRSGSAARGRKRTLRIAAKYADVWNAAGGSPEEVAASSAILDQHCADVGRDPSQIRRSVQFRVGADELDQVRATTEGYVKVGVTDFLLIVRGADPAAIGERLAAQLPRLRELG